MGLFHNHYVFFLEYVSVVKSILHVRSSLEQKQYNCYCKSTTAAILLHIPSSAILFTPCLCVYGIYASCINIAILARWSRPISYLHLDLLRLLFAVQMKCIVPGQPHVSHNALLPMEMTSLHASYLTSNPA